MNATVGGVGDGMVNGEMTGAARLGMTGPARLEMAAPVNCGLGRAVPGEAKGQARFGESANKFAARFGKSIREQITSGWTKLGKLGRNLHPRAARQLRLCETLPLGERRFLSVVQFEGQKFLIGSAANSVVLLTRLEKCEEGLTSPRRHCKKKPAATAGRRKQKSK